MTLLSTQKRRQGFSLLELMVVVTIIGILLTILFPASSQVVKQMRKTQASRAATELRTAITNYYAEYKRFPAVNSSGGGGNQDATVDTDSSSGLIGILMGENTRGILFFSEKKAKAREKPGLWFEGENVAGAELYDPWGNYYHVTIDSNYDNKITVPSRDGSGSDETIFKGAAVWSDGPLEDSARDDIYTY